MANNPIIFQLKKKIGNNRYDTYDIGTEQRFIGALLNSNLNNLEEQLLLGTDVYIEKYLDENENQIIEKSFHKNNISHNQAKNYYKLITSIYKEPIDKNKYYFENNTFYIPNNSQDIVFGNSSSVEYPSEKTLYMINNQIFKLNNKKIDIFPLYENINQKDDLYYIGENNSTLILSKIITKKTILDNGIEKNIIMESITNYL